jgi:hypothetical protein
MVHTREQALRYYDLYYPEYPDIVKEALVNKIDELRVACMKDSKLRAKHCAPPPVTAKCDFVHEAEVNNMAQLIKDANERLDRLIIEED